jgi:hypothetical protein
VRAEAGIDRVLADVFESGVVVILALDQSRGVPALKEAAAAAVATVESLRVRAVHQVHAGREIHPGRLDDQVVVRAEEAARVDAPAKPLGCPLDQLDEVDSVEVAAEKKCAAGGAAGDVVEAVGQIAATHPGHVDRR